MDPVNRQSATGAPGATMSAMAAARKTSVEIEFESGRGDLSKLASEDVYEPPPFR
jgi:hypothetical protein